MVKYGSYLVCREHVQEVRKFLSKFFEEQEGRYNHETWITFKIPNSKFIVNLMEGKDQQMTQNMTFEIGCNSKKELEEFAKKYDCKIKDFLATGTSKNYKYYYIEIFSPENICKIEISYSEDIK